MIRLRALRGGIAIVNVTRGYITPVRSRESELQKLIKDAATRKPTLVDVNTLLEWGTTGSGKHKDIMVRVVDAYRSKHASLSNARTAAPAAQHSRT